MNKSLPFSLKHNASNHSLQIEHAMKISEIFNKTILILVKMSAWRKYQNLGGNVIDPLASHFTA
jgi:hypothetical protein